MNDTGSRPDPQHRPGSGERELQIPFGEFVALMALLMALTALSIDIMLPALPQIGEFFALAAPLTTGSDPVVASAWDGDTMVGALPLVHDHHRLCALRCDYSPGH